MSRANTLIREVRRDNGLTLKQVEFATHYARTTIHTWEMGRGTVDPDYMARLYQLTGDIRLGQFIVPALRPLRARHEPPPISLDEANRLALNAGEHWLQCARHVMEITRDGKVNSDDDVLICQLDHQANHLVEQLNQLRSSIAHWRNADGGRAA